ncbi:hypothetical protein ACVMAJ_006856 [Bradyrhizobium sp. USDA 4448]
MSSITVGAIPIGATLSDGNGHSFTAQAGNTSVDVTSWSLPGLKITPVTGANFTLTISAIAKDAQGDLSSTTTATESVVVTPTVAVAVGSSHFSIAASTTTVTFSFSDAPTDFSLAHVSAVGPR